MDLGCREPRPLALAARWLRAAMQTYPWPMIAAKFIAVAPLDPVATEMAEELTRRVRACPNSTILHKAAGFLRPLEPLDPAKTPAAVTALFTAFAERASAPAWDLADELCTSGRSVRGTVVAERDDRYGIELEIGLLAWVQAREGRRCREGDTLDLSVVKVDRQKGRVEVCPSGSPTSGAEPGIEIGGVQDGIVSGAADYGVFVRLGDRSGLIHDSRLRDPDGFRRVYPLDSHIRVTVLASTPKGLDLTPADPDLRVDAMDPASLPSVEIGAEYDAVVTGICDRRVRVQLGERAAVLADPRSLSPAGLRRLYPVGTGLRVRVTGFSHKVAQVEPASGVPEAPDRAAGARDRLLPQGRPGGARLGRARGARPARRLRARGDRGPCRGLRSFLGPRRLSRPASPKQAA